MEKRCNKNNLPSNVIPKDRMIDMVYKQYMAYKTKPATIEDRLSVLEEKVDNILEKLSWLFHQKFVYYINWLSTNFTLVIFI